MQMPLHADVVAAARVLRDQPCYRRHFVLKRMLREAERAHAWRSDWKRHHPIWGDGTLLGAALRRNPLPEPVLVDDDYCRCLALVYAALAQTFRSLQT